MDRSWAHSSEIPVEPSQGADVAVISLLMFLSPDCRRLFHWPLCPAGFPHCRLPWKPFLGSNPSHPGANLCQTTAVLLSRLQENQDLVLPLALMSLVSSKVLFRVLCWQPSCLQIRGSSLHHEDKSFESWLPETGLQNCPRGEILTSLRGISLSSQHLHLRFSTSFEKEIATVICLGFSIKTSASEFWEKEYFSFSCPTDRRTWSFLVICEILNFKVKIIWEKKALKVQKIIWMWWLGDIYQMPALQHSACHTTGLHKGLGVTFCCLEKAVSSSQRTDFHLELLGTASWI